MSATKPNKAKKKGNVLLLLKPSTHRVKHSFYVYGGTLAGKQFCKVGQNIADLPPLAGKSTQFNIIINNIIILITIITITIILVKTVIIIILKMEANLIQHEVHSIILFSTDLVLMPLLDEAKLATTVFQY